MASDGLPHQVSSQTSAWRHTCCCGVRAGWDSITARGSSRTRPVLTHSARTLHCDCRGSHTVPALSTAPVHSSHHCLTYMPRALCELKVRGAHRRIATRAALDRSPLLRQPYGVPRLVRVRLDAARALRQLGAAANAAAPVRLTRRRAFVQQCYGKRWHRI